MNNISGIDRIAIIEAEILETSLGIEIQDLKWKEIVKKIIREHNLQYYPTKKYFALSGEMQVYKDICKMAEHSYMADIMGVETWQQYNISECIFRTMLACEICYMPDSAKYFKTAKENLWFRYLEKYSTLENERIRLGLLKKEEYEKLSKK